MKATAIKSIFKSNFGFLFLFFLFLSTNTVEASINDVVNVSFNFEIIDGTENSSSYKVEINSSGSSLSSVRFNVKFIGFENKSIEIVENGIIETNNNIIGEYYMIEVNQRGTTSNSTLFSFFPYTNVLTHLKHVYYEWKLGSPTPNEQGFGLGAIQDSKILQKIVQSSITTLEDAASLGEQVINLLLGTAIDYDNNGSSINPSDNYGFFTYSYGMRDHIRNAYTSSGATQSLVESGGAIYNNYSLYLGEDKTTFLQSLNSSSAVGAQIYNVSLMLLNLSEVSALASNLSKLQTLTDQYINFIQDSYLEFRNKAMNFNFTADIIITTSMNTFLSTSDTKTTDMVSFSLQSLISLIIVTLIFKRIRLEDN